jgi:hypothetical protein
MFPDLVGRQPVEDHQVRRRLHHPDGDERRLAPGDAREDQRAVGALAVEVVEFVAGEAPDDLDAVEDGVAGDRLAVPPDDLLGVDRLVEPLQRNVRLVLPEVVDHVAVEPGGEDPGVLADLLAAARLVDVQHRVDDPADDADSGVLATAALVVRHDRRRHVEFGRQVGLGDLEVRPPLPEGRPRVVAQSHLPGDLLGEFGARPASHCRHLRPPGKKGNERSLDERRSTAA